MADRSQVPIAVLGAAVAGLAVVATGAGSWPHEAGLLLVRVALWGAVLLSAAVVGAVLSRSPRSGASHLLWDGAAGFGPILALLLWVSSMPGGYRPRVLLGVVIGLSLVAMVVRAVLRRRVTAEPSLPRPAVALLALVAVAGLIWNRVPASFFDSLVYHFANPQLWLVEGRATPLAWSLHSWFPPGMSLLYGVGLAVAGDAAIDTAANDANLLLALLLLGCVVDLGRRLWGAFEGSLAGLLLVATPLYLNAVAVPAADLGHGLFGFGAVACWLLARRTGEPDWTRRAVLFVTGAVLTKWLGFLLLGGVGLLMIGWPPGGKPRLRPGPALARLGWLLAPGLVALLPWLVGNHRVAGNPFAPVLQRTLAPGHGDGVLAEGGLAAFEQAARGGLPTHHDLAHLWPRLFAGDAAESRIYPTPAWGWLPLLVLPVALLRRRDDRRIAVLLAVCAGWFGLWLLTYRWERFLVAPTGLLCLALAAALAPVLRRRPLGWLATVGLVAIVGLTLIQTCLGIQAFTGGLSVAIGRDTPARFLARARPAEAVLQAAVGTLDRRTDRLLLVGDSRHHRISYPHVAPGVYNRHPFASAIASGQDDAGITMVLRRQGFTHLLVEPARAIAAGGPSLEVLRSHPQRLAAYLDSLGPPRLAHQGVALYALDGR